MALFIHKARKPDETIAKIRSILAELGLFPVESWYNFTSGSYSVRITDMNNESVGTNGKGIAKNYALASAYGEFMERLENRMLIRHEYGLHKNDKEEYPDSKMREFGEVYDEFKKLALFEHFVRDSGKEDGLKKLKCFPYYNLAKGKTAYLPSDLLNAYCGTNGMCAGNTKEEAVLQGLCEVLERYVATTLFTGKSGVPRIPACEVKNAQLKALIDGIEKKGYTVMIKDCSLGGKYPVVATLFFNKKNTKYKISFASDPVFEVALSRSITEISQGVDCDGFEKEMLPVPWLSGRFDVNELSNEEKVKNMRQFFCDGRAQYQSFFVYNDGKPEYRKAFIEEFTCYEKVLAQLVKLVHDAGFEVYVRDVSYLGFPAYRVYVPGMSEVFFPSRKEMRSKSKASRKILLNFKNASEGDLKILAEYIETRLNLPSKGNQSFFNQITRIYLGHNSDLCGFSARSFLALIYMRLKEYKKALRYLQEDLDLTASAGEAGAYKSAMLATLKFKNDGCPGPEIEKHVGSIFGEKIAAHMAGYLNDPGRIFANYKLPACGKCEDCGVRKDCKVDYWESIESRIWAKMLANPISQEQSLGRLLSGGEKQ